MARDVDAALAAAMQLGAVQPVLLIEIGTSDADNPVRAWNGIGDLIWNGDTYTGTGVMGRISTLEEAVLPEARGVTFELSGVPQDLLALALGDMRQGRPARIWVGAVDQTGAMVGDPYLLFEGLTDVPEIEDTADTVALRITAESLMIDLKRPRVRRFTPEDQRLSDADDLGFDYVAGLQDATLEWGVN